MPVGARLGDVEVGGTKAELWFAWVGDHTARVREYSEAYLSSEERSKLSLYRSGGAAERYVVTRSLVRLVLGQRLGVEPRSLEVQRTDTGKPVLTAGIHFNVSHSGDLILLGLSDERAVGVDIERRREVQRVSRLVERWLDGAERAEVTRMRSTGIAESDAFLRVWSLKEARLKALGVGIVGAARADMASVAVRPLDDLLERITPVEDDGYVGAVAFA